MGTVIDFGGNSLIVEEIRAGATAPGQTGTVVPTIANTNTLDGDQTVTGDKTWEGVSVFSGDVTFNVNPIIGANKTLNLDSALATLVSNAATITKYAVQVTSEALTTAAGSGQAFVLTLTGVAATDLVFVQGAGGTNTREHIAYKAICTTNTVTVTVSNIGPTDAINGTLIFNVWILKA